MSSTKSAVRALRILEEFGAQKQPLRLKDVAINLHYPISSAAALLKSLVSCGYLSFDRNSRYYYPTDKLPALGAQLPGYSCKTRQKRISQRSSRATAWRPW